jgi:hypothetical protein
MFANNAKIIKQQLFLQIKLQQKSLAIFTKSHKRLQQKIIYVCK